MSSATKGVLLMNPLRLEVAPTRAAKKRLGRLPLGKSRRSAAVRPSRCCTVPAKMVRAKMVSKLRLPRVAAQSSRSKAPKAQAATAAPAKSTPGRTPRTNTPRTKAPYTTNNA